MNTHLKQNTWLAICMMGGFSIALSAQAASFDCAKAQAKVEHLICDNPEISKLDDELAAGYKAELKDEAQVEVIRQSQKK